MKLSKPEVRQTANQDSSAGRGPLPFAAAADSWARSVGRDLPLVREESSARSVGQGLPFLARGDSLANLVARSVGRGRPFWAHEDSLASAVAQSVGQGLSDPSFSVAG